MVMLGALIAGTGILKKSSILEIFKNHPEAGKIANVKMNTDSFLEGMLYIENTKS